MNSVFMGNGIYLPSIVYDGHDRILACLPPKPNKLPKWRDSMPTIPRSEWREFSLRDQCRILDQNGYGSYVGHGSDGAAELARRIAGKTPVSLSACSIYAGINGGRDQGAVVSDAMEWMMSKGICLEKDVPEGMIYMSKIPQGAWQQAPRFKMQGGYHLQTFDEIMSALMLGWIPVYGIMVGDNFGDLDSEGVTPFPRGGGGHCMYGCGAKKSARLGEWLLDDVNSWGVKFGQGGFCYLREGHFDKQCDAFAIQVMVEDPQDSNQPVVAS